jgi:hypothetical protein
MYADSVDRWLQGFAKKKLQAAGWNVEQAINRHFAEEQVKAEDNAEPQSALDQLQNMGFANDVSRQFVN